MIHHIGEYPPDSRDMTGFDYCAPDEEKETTLEEKMGLLVTETFFAISRANRHHTIPQCEEATVDYLRKLIERVK